MTFVLIPAGSFTMGSGDAAKDGSFDAVPAHPVRIAEPFYMQTTEVTQAQWIAAMSTNPAMFKARTNPVERVSWDDIQSFLKVLNDREGCGGCYRLPSEAEWEYAYRAGSSGRYYWGDDAGAMGQYAWYDRNSGGQSHAVGQLKPNAWGLYDMAGNLYEWVADCYHKNYAGAPDNGAAWTGSCHQVGAGAVLRVLRGGSWYGGYILCDANTRMPYTGVSRPGDDVAFPRDDVGFRVVRVGSASTP